ncbi:putative zinc-binding protein [Methanosarcina barkeri]|nr:putative zinc-binding protein [Methanosarcina barkeri]
MESAGTESINSLPGKTDEMKKSSGKRKSTLIFACSGLSNTGKLTMQAASTLAFRRPNLYRAAAAHKGVDAVEDAVSDGFKIIALDGCTDRCATKKLDEAGMKADVYLMVTELGIEKTRSSDVKPEYVEKIVRAIKEA